MIKMETNNNLRLNEWISPEEKSFSYKIFWPYSDNFNPDKALVDVYVKLVCDPKQYIGTFFTLQEINEWFNRFGQNGECANGTYIPFGGKNKEILLKKVSYYAIEKTLEDLIEKDKFLEYFEKVEE